MFNVERCRKEYLNQGDHWRRVAILQACDEIEQLRAEISELETTFDTRWKADMRAIKRWQEGHPGNELIWPDHTDLCVWLLEELEKKKAPSRREYCTCSGGFVSSGGPHGSPHCTRCHKPVRPALLPNRDGESE